jgi:hypothetical protein
MSQGACTGHLVSSSPKLYLCFDKMVKWLIEHQSSLKNQRLEADKREKDGSKGAFGPVVVPSDVDI